MEIVSCNLRRMLRLPLHPPDASAPTSALACRRSERDRGRLVAVELHGQLRRRDVPARSGCGRIARARLHRSARQWLCSADPCFQFASDGECDVPQYCAAGDYIDCGTVGPVVSGTLPDAIGSLACRSKITRLCARPPTAAHVPAASNIHTYIHTYVYIHNVYVYIYMYVHMHICTHTYIYI